MQSIILEVLEEIACPNTGTCQINMQSSSAREMIAKKLVDKLDEYTYDCKTKQGNQKRYIVTETRLITI